MPNREDSPISISVNPRDALTYVINRQVTYLFKDFLHTLEDNNCEHIESLNKLADNLPPEYNKYIDLADWFTDEKAERLRKRVLEKGNDTIRNIREELDKYDIDFNS